MSPKVFWLAAAVVVVLASCSGGPTGASPTPDSRSAEHNAADVAFAEDMIPHHRQAVDMTAMVPSRSTNPDLLVMATHISSDQQAEILTMKPSFPPALPGCNAATNGKFADPVYPAT